MTATREDRTGELLELVLERNPFQRARIAGLGLGARPQLSELPPLEKHELVLDQQRTPPFGTNLTHPLARYMQLHQTSGTTGPPLRVLDTAEDWAWWRSLFADTLSVTGVRPGDRVALAFSFGPHVQFWAAKEGLQELGAMAIALGGMTSAQRLRTIAEVGATALMCTPTYALRLFEVAMEERLERAFESLQRVICTGEPGASLPGVRRRIEEGFGARCYDHAGLTEAGPFGYPCTAGGGMQVYDDEFACEIVGPGLRPVGQGERGELVLTPLRRTGFPVLRYRTGDVVVATDERCPAGHADRWLPGGIVGRTDDMVVIRGMNVYPSSIEEAVRGVRGAGEFRITFYSERSGMDEVKLEVELPGGAEARELQELMRQQLGLRVRVVPVALGVLPRRPGQGAARRGRAGAGMSWKPIRGASEQVAVQIQHHIQREGLGPDDFLGREEDLAAEFGVSRPTLREALKLLASGSLIRANKGPGGGIFVARTAEQGISHSVSDSIAMMLETGAVTLDQLLDARLLLEVPLSGRAAQRADAALVSRLRAAVATEAAADPDDLETLATADGEVHRAVAAAAGNRIAEALIGWVFEVLQPSLIATLHGAVIQSAIVEQHEALLAAIERGDPGRAERAMKDHLLYVRDVLRMVEARDGGG